MTLKLELWYGIILNIKSGKFSRNLIKLKDIRYKIKFFLKVKIKVWQGNQNNKNIYIKRKFKIYIA